MMRPRHRLARLAVSSAVLCALLRIGAASATPDHPVLQPDSLRLPNACTASGQAALRYRLAAPGAGVRKAEEAWQLINALLCAPADARNLAYLRAHLGKTVREELSASGSEDEVRTLPVDDDMLRSLPQAGAAWDARLDGAVDELVVYFMSDEATSRSRKLALVRGAWRIVTIMEASD